jgi:lactoylglutathione lyase
MVDRDGHRIELVRWPAGHPDGMTAADLSGRPGDG